MAYTQQTHRIGDSGCAYGLCQTESRIKDGDILFIEPEKVVGLAGTWPVAITLEHGALHTIADDGDASRLLKDMKVTRLGLVQAIELAVQREWPVHPKFIAAAAGTFNYSGFGYGTYHSKDGLCVWCDRDEAYRRARGEGVTPVVVDVLEGYTGTYLGD